MTEINLRARFMEYATEALPQIMNAEEREERVEKYINELTNLEFLEILSYILDNLKNEK